MADRSGATEGSGPPGAANKGGIDGPLTAAEQVAVLDARLEASTGEFDSIILEEQTRQREAARESTRSPSSSGSDTGASGAGSPSGPYGGEVVSGGAGGGGGMGVGNSGPGRPAPANPPRFPPPDDIPSGDDDDVVARQLREAAMREPDPDVREKLWDEYRKYKGIES
ncbi:MAG: hypothetical protein CME40_00285 [Haliea sp.]|nr:hypothetical protein [Haliea sp.]